jgi:hypothetical protein
MLQLLECGKGNNKKNSSTRIRVFDARACAGLKLAPSVDQASDYAAKNEI